MSDTKTIDYVFSDLVTMITQLCYDFSNADPVLQNIVGGQQPSEGVMEQLKNLETTLWDYKEMIQMNYSYDGLFKHRYMTNSRVMVRCLPDIIGMCLSYMKTRYSSGKK
jgi:hypothetical protein